MVAFNDLPAPDSRLPDVDLRPVTLPVRSTAYSLKPLAVGTGMVESLWGYLVRLSDAHSVRIRDFFWKVVAPLARIHQTKNNGNYLVTLKGERAVKAAAATEMITMREGFERTTFVRSDRHSCIMVKTCDWLDFVDHP